MGPRDGIEEVLGAGNRDGGNFGEGGALGEAETRRPLACPTGLFSGVSAVDGGAENLLGDGLVEGLVIVIGG